MQATNLGHDSLSPIAIDMAMCRPQRCDHLEPAPELQHCSPPVAISLTIGDNELGTGLVAHVAETPR